MAEGFTGSRVIFIVLRYMRAPIMILVCVYAASMLGWVLIPAWDPAGNPRPMSFFHAFYFLTYTATTTGFGELPYAFSEAQRMWGIVSLYASVIAWLYAIGTIIKLVQNPHLLAAIAERRFARRVRRITEPFVIICGFGNTGSLLARGLSDAGVIGVVVDKDPERIKALYLRDYRVDMPGLAADARIPQHLIDAGLLQPNCTAVVALTSDEQVNLKIAVTARLMHPTLRIVIQSTSTDFEEVLATLGGDIHIIDPFQTYARYLAATILDPAIHTASQWISGSPGATLDSMLAPPGGRWILCGFGRMGRRIREALIALEIPTVVIEPDAGEAGEEIENVIAGRATQATLEAAGVRETAGIVAGTNTDSDNLSILVNARALNPDIFVIVRQNLHLNEVVFQAARADFIMQPSLVSARRILFLLIAPLLKTFFEELRQHATDAGDTFVAETIQRLRETVGGTHPRLWTLDTLAQPPSALKQEVSLGDLLRDPTDRNRRLACVPLVAQSPGEETVMPDTGYVVRPGCRILFCGTPRARWLLDSTLNNEYTLRYLATGVDEPRGLFLRWLFRKRNGQKRNGLPVPAE